MKSFNVNIIIFLILMVGIIYRITITADHNFIFNMDNGRDMVEVREMMVLQKPRLIGQTTSIEGVFYGPGWYYLLAIPFVLSGGNPYASILMEILLWAVGGYFLLYLVNKFYGLIGLISVSCLWIASNFLILGNQYAFNPNPVLFLTPVFIYTLLRYIESGKWWFNCLAWFLAGIFLHFEVTVGLFMPLVIVLSIFLTEKREYFKGLSFYLGIFSFGLTLIPQLIFEFRHSFFMTQSLLSYRSTSHSDINGTLLDRGWDIFRGFYNVLIPTYMNFTFFTNAVIIVFGLILFYLLFIKKSKLDLLTKITITTLFTPLLGMIPLKVGVLSWYFNASLVSAIILVGFTLSTLAKIKQGYLISLILTGVLAIFTLQNMFTYIKAAQAKQLANSYLRTELIAIDYVYKKAAGQNFKVYTYLPSVIDYPYQYLFWWYGLRKYGYLPQDYAYSPNKPPYISQKEQFDTGSHPESSGLVFLIKEPDQISQRHLWENTFRNLPLISSEEIGPLIIEIRQEQNR